MARGMVDEQVFVDIAAAIRKLNGVETTYKPADMAPAILAAIPAEPDYKLRAVVDAYGSMEINYLGAAGFADGDEAVQAFDIDMAGYASDSARPWHDIRTSIFRVTIDASVAQVGVTTIAHWFNGFSNLYRVDGFENLSGVVDVTRVFFSCSKLETIYATSFDNSTITAGTYCVYACSKLVGGADSYAPSLADGASVLKLGAGGVLTSIYNDTRVWMNCAVLTDNTALLYRDSNPSVVVKATDRFCLGAMYKDANHSVLSTYKDVITKVTILDSTAGIEGGIKLNYLFAGLAVMTEVVGMSNFVGVTHANYMFSTCQALKSLDLCGFNPSTLGYATSMFTGCTALTTITAYDSWAPASGLSGFGMFYNCKSLVGGAGTAYNASNTSATYFRLDMTGTPGYLTRVVE